MTPYSTAAAAAPAVADSASASDATDLLRDAAEAVRVDLEAVDAEIQRRLASDIALIRALGAHIVGAGGKRLRPMVLLLAARACGYRGAAHITLAAVIEFIHTATLLHDDVVDASAMRRGKATANHVWGNEASVLVGDFLYARAFEMMLDADDMEVMRILAATTRAIAEGEVMQLMNTGEANLDEAAYLRTIRCKTAKLFESAARLGAMLGGNDGARHSALAEYGMEIGIAFQLVDDWLDYAGDGGAIGKQLGDDLAEGKPTLPLIHALRVGSAAQRDTIRAAIEGGGRERFADVLAIVESTGALTYTSQRAKQHSDAAIAALSALDSSRYKDALIGLARFAVQRGH